MPDVAAGFKGGGEVGERKIVVQTVRRRHG